MRVAGIDGTPGGWVAVVLRDGRFESACRIPRIESDFAELGEVTIIGIDVPIGFGPGREADSMARRRLKGSASTVFSVPSRAVLERPFGPGLGVSAQSHAIGPRVLHVTDLAQADGRFREVHPELSFQTMNADKPLGCRKKSAAGALRRMELLKRHRIVLGNLDSAGFAPLDDVLDAAAAAWSAHRIALGGATYQGSLPYPPQLIDGNPVAIWF